MKKKKKTIKNFIIFLVFFLLAGGIFAFGVFEKNDIFSSKEIVFYEPPSKTDTKLNIDVEEIKENIENMTSEEIEEIIVEIEKEIERLESNLNSGKIK